MHHDDLWLYNIKGSCVNESFLTSACDSELTSTIRPAEIRREDGQINKYNSNGEVITDLETPAAFKGKNEKS